MNFRKKKYVISLFCLALILLSRNAEANLSLPITESVQDIRQDSLPDSIFLKHFATVESQYNRYLDKADWAYKHGLNKRAKKFYTKAGELNPYSNYIKSRLDEITHYKYSFRNVLFGFDLDQPNLLIKSLTYLIIYFILSMLVLLVFILYHRTRMEQRQNYEDNLKEMYQGLLVDYLFTTENNRNIPDEIKLVAASKFNRKILIDQMIDLSINLSGDTKKRLRELYFALGLHNDSIRKAMGRKWHIKIKGFKELAFMDITEANAEIIRCLQHKNDIVRMEAQLAMIRLNRSDSFGFLDHLKKTFTLWEQLTVYETIMFHDLEAPKFDRWLISNNKSVVLFSLKMIEIFKQHDTYPNLFWMVVNNDDEIRNHTIRVIGNLKIKEALPHLKRLYKSETYRNCLEIIRAMKKMPDQSMLNFLKLVIDKEDDVQLQIEAAIAINNFGETGKIALNRCSILIIRITRLLLSTYSIKE